MAERCARCPSAGTGEFRGEWLCDECGAVLAREPVRRPPTRKADMAKQAKAPTEHLKQLSFDRLGQLEGGRLATAIDVAIRQAVTDIDLRPTDKAVRTITLTLKLKPKKSDRLSVTAQATVKLPADKTETLAEVTSGDLGSGALFNPLSGSNLDQKPIPGCEPEPAAIPA